MICLRCGRCCTELSISIINPGSIRPDGTVGSDDRGSMVSKPAGQKCPHLSYQQDFQKQIAVCTIHHLPCYKGTPCEQFEQFGPQNSACMMAQLLSQSPRRRSLRNAVEFQK